ncbi:acetyl-CoA acetyltransferase [Leptospira kobayashii]|uniref:Acetyl-CoA acetyltransferase n=1 Tax=Leptospira kobayashii TaxID=1917830 RepID=A0ABN6KG17_9LEPT|nr:thiolase family protein [Leptospira kobayashii]BDA80120.1 acetyl-CoA acetyltransferase [Leptospira kobayashii]
MTPILLGVADTIESEFNAEEYKSSSALEKYYKILFRSVDKLFTFLGTDRTKIAPYLTDFVSVEAQSLAREGYGFTVRDANDLGFTGIACHVVDLGGASVGGALQQAYTIISSNPDSIVLVAAADVPKSVFKQVSDLKRLTATVCHKDWEIPYGSTLIGLYAILAERLMKDSGVNSEDFEKITKCFREKAISNPRAFQFEKELTDKQLRKPLAGPYSTPMIAIVTDHGFATLITTEAKKQELIDKGIIRKDAEHIYLSGAGHAAHTEYFIQKKDLASPAAIAAERAFSLSGWEREDIDYAWIYDCFTGMIINQASLYFGKPVKEVAAGLHEGKIPTGNRQIPINLGGGILNYQAAMSLSGAAGLIDVASQYGLAVDPIPGRLSEPPKVSLLGGNGGIDSINSVIIFSKEAPKKGRRSAQPTRNLGVNVPDAKDGEDGVILSASAVHFNPGGEKKPPYLLCAVTTNSGSMLLTNLFSAAGEEIKSADTIEIGKTKVKLKIQNGILQSHLI